MSIHAKLSAPLALTGMPEDIRGWQEGDADVRLRLWRWWGPVVEPNKWLTWIMLNPSTADGVKNDPTLLRIIAFTHRWGFTGLRVHNVYPFRTPSPKELGKIVLGWDERQDWSVRDEIHRNHQRIAKDLITNDAAMVAWGCPAGALGGDTDLWVESLFDTINDPDGPRLSTLKLWSIGLSAGGAPKHPMARGLHRVPNDATPVRFKNPGTVSFGDDEERDAA